MNNRELYESIMKKVTKQFNNILNEDILADNTEQYIDNPNYDFYVDMYRYLSFIINNLSKLNGGNPILIKGLGLTGEIPYNHRTIGESFSLGHIVGLAIEEALMQCLLTYINGYNGDQDDIEDITSIIGEQGFDISDNIRINVGRDNMPISDFYIYYNGKKYSIQIKAVKSSNEGVREMNAAIRKGADMCIAVVYNMLGNDVLIESLQLYVPDVNGTYEYISRSMGNRKKLALNKNNSFITIGPRLLFNNDGSHQIIKKNN